MIPSRTFSLDYGAIADFMGFIDMASWHKPTGEIDFVNISKDILIPLGVFAFSYVAISLLTREKKA
jgi:hypothetical protein